MKKPEEVARQLGMPYESLDEATRKVARHVAARQQLLDPSPRTS